MRELAREWSLTRGLPSPRVCPFCCTAHGTPRHVVMSCPETAPLVDAVRDAVEAALTREQCAVTLCSAGEEWASERCAGWPPVPETSRSRWPVLAAWRWLVALPARERAFIAAGMEEGCPGPPTVEGPADFAYRGAMPRALGQCLYNCPGCRLAVRQGAARFSHGCAGALDAR